MLALSLLLFPIGIYDVNDPKHVEAVAESGFDSIYASPGNAKATAALARECKRHGLSLLLPPVPLLDRPMPDWYPVPHLKLDSVADRIDEARRHWPGEKPFWMVLQAMDWRDFPQRDPKKPRIGRFPDRGEIRFMSYLAVLHGAEGLFYFTFQKPLGKNLLDYPELWQAVTSVARELKALKPILEKGRPAPLPFPPDPDGAEAKAWHFRGRDYVVILNRKGKALEKMPDQLLGSGWRPLFEARRDPRDLLVKAGPAWHLRPYQVMVLESSLHLGGASPRMVTVLED